MADGIGTGVTATRQAIENGADLILSVGGEGTTNEVVNGIYSTDKSVKLGFIRAGTVNDYLRTIDWPVKLEHQLDSILNNEYQVTPLLLVESESQTKYGLNVADIGIGAKIAYMASVERRLTWIRSSLRYQLLSLRALFGWKNIPVEITIDGSGYSGDLSLLTSGFSNYSGAYHLHPHANPFGEKMAFTMAMNFSKFEMLKKMKMLERGDHNAEMDNIWMGHCREIIIEAEEPMLFEVDGEPFTKKSTTIKFTAIPEAISVVKI